MNCLYLLIYFSQRVINEGFIKYLFDILLAKGTNKVASMSFCPNFDRGHQKQYPTMQQHMQSCSSTWPITQPIKPPHEAESGKAKWQAAERGKQIIWELHQNWLCNPACVTHEVEEKRFALVMLTRGNSC